MIHRHRAILFIFFTICVLCCASTPARAQAPFRWEAVSYKGNDYVTLRSLSQFYYFKQTKSGKTITLESRLFKMIIKSGSKECHLNGVLFILSHAITSRNGRYLLSRTDLNNLIDPVLRPTHNKKARPFKTVVIDAGHGGKDSGSGGHLQDEKYYALKVAKMLKATLQKKGYHVVMTRDRDVYISLAGRVKIANRYPNAIFVCIHFNSGQSRANGIETFTISPVGTPHLGRGYRPRDAKAVPGNHMGSASVALATAIHSRSLMYLQRYQIADRGIKHARFNVLTGIKIPAILLEGGFLSNRTEATKVHSLTYQQYLVSAIARGIDLYRKSVTTPKRAAYSSSRRSTGSRSAPPTHIRPR